MLVRLLPEQVSERWETFAPLIAESLPPTVGKTKRGMTNILRAILMEQLVCWIFYREDVPTFILVTKVDLDNITLQRNLLIYAFTAIEHVTKRDFDYTLERISSYARSQGCRSIVAFTVSSKISKYMEYLGFTGEYKFLSLEV